jgi:hypothetical protein
VITPLPDRRTCERRGPLRRRSGRSPTPRLRAHRSLARTRNLERRPVQGVGAAYEDVVDSAALLQRDRFAVHYANSMLKKAAGFHRRRDPGWPSIVDLLSEEAEDSLTGKVW